AARILEVNCLTRRQRRVDVLVDEQAPHVLERVFADQFLDVDAAVAKRSAILVRLGNLGLEGDDSFEAGAELGIGRSHRREPYTTGVCRGSRCVYGPPPMPHRVTLIPGDGTGPELTEATRRVLEATGVGFDWDVRQAGVEVMESAGTPLPDETIASIKENSVALNGPITTPIATGFRSVNVALRHALARYGFL